MVGAAQCSGRCEEGGSARPYYSYSWRVNTSPTFPTLRSFLREGGTHPFISWYAFLRLLPCRRWGPSFLICVPSPLIEAVTTSEEVFTRQARACVVWPFWDQMNSLCMSTKLQRVAFSRLVKPMNTFSSSSHAPRLSPPYSTTRAELVRCWPHCSARAQIHHPTVHRHLRRRFDPHKCEMTVTHTPQTTHQYTRDVNGLARPRRSDLRTHHSRSRPRP